MAAASAQADITSSDRVNPCCASTRPLVSSSNTSLTRESSMNRTSGSSIHCSTATLMTAYSRERPCCTHHLDAEQPDVGACLGNRYQHQVIPAGSADSTALRVEP